MASVGAARVLSDVRLGRGTQLCGARRGAAVLVRDDATDVPPIIARGVLIDVPGSTVHIALFVERGIFIIEMVNCEELARDRAYEFCFVCLPTAIRGATGSTVRPVALV
jgi:kynurenine formamidase